MAASDDKRTGASNTVSNRVTKFRLPERTSRPSDDAYFDRVLSAVEHKEITPPPAEAESPINASPGAASAPANDPETTAPKGISHPISLRQVEAANSATTSAEVRKDAVDSLPADNTPSSRQGTTLREDTDRRESLRPDASSASPTHDISPSFAEFRKRWSLFLTETHMNLCEEIFRHTAAVGRDNYDTTASKLCQAVNKSRRHTFLLLQQLEKMGFVTRKEIRDNNRLLGIRIWFHLVPHQE